MRIIDRLLEYLQIKKITAYSFERQCQVANGYLKKQQKGKGSIGSDILERIHKIYPDLNLVWLLSGNTDMLLGEIEINEEKLVLHEDRPYYTREEYITALEKRITLLEASLADKDKIISLMSSKNA